MIVPSRAVRQPFLMSLLLYQLLVLLPLFGGSTPFPSTTPNPMIAMCEMNRGDPTWDFICSSVPSTAVVVPTQEPEAPCKPILPRRKVLNDTLPLSELLSNGIAEMQSQVSQQSHDKGSQRLAIFMLGNTGGGKTTVTQIVAGGLQNLHASRYDDGHLVIIDDAQRIGAPTTTSRTLIPEYVVHPETGVAFWDCPGFDDTRGAQLDIASMYFINHALERTTHAKFLFIVKHGSVVVGNDRLDFDLLATHAVRLVKNVDKFVDSIGLVVTKVPGYEGGTVLSEETILRRVENFLNLYVSTTLENIQGLANGEKKTELENKVLYVQGLLGQRGEGGRKFYFVRNPTKCGPLAEMSSFLYTKDKVTNLYNNSLIYSPVASTDFHFTLKTETLLKIKLGLLPKTLEQVRSPPYQIVASMTNQFQKIFYENLGYNMKKKLEFLHTSANLIKSYISNLTDATSKTEKTEFIGNLRQLHGDLAFHLNCTNLALWLQLESQINFFEKVTNSDATFHVPNAGFIKKMTDFSWSLANLTAFYEFCDLVERELAQYPNYVMFEKLAQGQSGSMVFGDEEMLRFLNENYLVAVPQQIFFLWSNIKMEDKTYLASVVKDFLPRQPDMKCEQSSLDNTKTKLTFSGRKVKMSHVNAQSNWPAPCTKESVLEISVVAMERVYFDEDLDARGMELRLSVVVPVWDVVAEPDSQRRIILDGVEPPAKIKGQNERYDGARGTDGEDGEKGGDAGSFFGVYSTALNAHLLRITANGGNGGKGGDGGDGHMGGNGEDAKFEDFPNAYISALNHLPFIEIDLENQKVIENVEDVENEKCVEQWVKTQTLALLGLSYATQHGKLGGDGGNGGNGGKGGAPGSPGAIQLNTVKTSFEKFQFRSSYGESGQPGFGGMGGEGGKNGNGLTCILERTMVVILEWTKCFVEVNNSTGNKGTDGNPGTTTLTGRRPTSINQPWKAINDYKSNFFLQNSNSKLVFMTELGSSPDVARVMNPLAFAEQLETMEKSFFSFDQPISNGQRETHQHHYYQFLEDLNHFVRFKGESGLSPEEKVALNVIYGNVLSKLVALQSAGNRLNVIKTKEYFDALVTQLDTLKTAQKEEIIHSEAENFSKQLSEKAKQVENLISDTVQPAITDLQKSINEKNELLMLEISELISSAEDDLERRKLATKKYKEAKQNEILLSVVTTIGIVAATVLSGGAAAAAVRGTSEFLSIALLGSPATEPVSTFHLPTSVANLVNINRNHYENKIQAMERRTTAVIGAVNKIETAAVIGNQTVSPNGDSSLRNLLVLAERTKVTIETFKVSISVNLSAGNVDPVRILELERQLDISAKEMKEAVLAQQGKYNTINHGGNAETRINVKAVNEFIKEAAVLFEVPDGVFNVSTNSSKQLERMEAFVKEGEQNIKALELMRKHVYEEVIPHLISVNDLLNSEASQLAGQSQVNLSMKKWKMKGMLKNVRGYMAKITVEMKVAEEFQLAFDRLDEAFTLLIELYEHIERFQEKKELADFIGNVNGASEINEKITDQKLRGTLTRLEFYTHANLFLEDYYKAIHAFKQWVFPFASQYLLDSKFSKMTEAPNNLDDAVRIYKGQVTGLKTELDKYHATTTRSDGHQILSCFKSDTVSSESFYVWTNKKWQNSIQKLLSGEKVHLKADADTAGEYFEGKSAIKFKTVELVLIAHNTSRHAELNETLKHFQVVLEHSGTSVYKVNGEHYVMYDHPQTYRYSYEKSGNNQHVARNAVTHKVASENSDFLMSPYTWWGFQLIDAKRGGVGFPDLKSFENEVDLHLEGEGFYLDEGHMSKQALEELKIADFYESYDPDSDFKKKFVRYDDEKCSVEF